MKILVLAPHTDDGEYGCGGSLYRHIRNEDEVHYVAFSKCEESVLEGLPKDILVSEMYEATGRLGIRRENVRVLGYPVRRFDEHRQDILEELVMLRREISPRIVYTPSLHDTHQDHKLIAEEARRAFKNVTIYGYEMPWNNFTFNNQYFNVLDEECIEAKLQAVLSYKSQRQRLYADREFIYGQAKYHGVQTGRKYAEVFEVVRQVSDEFSE